MHAPLADDQFLYTQAARGASQGHDADEFACHLGNLAKSVHHALLEGLDLVIGLHVVEFAVERDALILLGNIACGKHQFQVGVHYAVGDKLGRVLLFASLGGGVHGRKLLGAQFGDSLFQDALIGLVAQVGDEAALLGAQQVARTANVEVLHGDLDARAQVAETLDGLQAAARVGAQGLAWRYQQVAEGLAAAASHASAQLVQVAQSVAVRIVDDDGVDVGHVDTILNDGGRQQHVIVVVAKVDDGLFQPLGRHLAVTHSYAGIGHYAVNHVLEGFELLDAVVDEEHLPVA